MAVKRRRTQDSNTQRRQINQKKKTVVNRFFREIWEKISNYI